jgi:hypothetical protein
VIQVPKELRVLGFKEPQEHREALGFKELQELKV